MTTSSPRSKTNRSIVVVTASCLAAALLGLSGCATPPDPRDTQSVAEFDEANDPAEPLNRAIFALNRGLDAALLKPAAGMYEHLIPPSVRAAVHNILANLKSPVILFNDALQGDGKAAGNTASRFAINTILGLGGIGDPATDLGYPAREEDFGQTLAIWGADEGPYLMLPILGPSNPRDAVGKAVDFLIDPFSRYAANSNRDYANYARTSVNATDDRARNMRNLDDIEHASLDFYATVRSLYRQKRQDAITNGQPPDGPPKNP